MSIPTPPGLESLVDLACRDGVDIRPTLLRVLTDLYVQKLVHTSEEESHYVALAQRLIETVDEATRTLVVVRLSAYPNPPQALRPYLGLAAPNLAAPHLAAALPNAGDAPATVPDDSFEDEDLFEPLVVEPAPQPQTSAPAPPPVTAGELAQLFFDATPQERRLVLIHLDTIAATDIQPMNGLADTVRRLETAALRHDRTAFAHELTGALALAPALAQRIVDDTTGEPLLVVARVLRMPASVLQRVMLFLNPTVGHSVQRVYELAALYDEISEPAAHHLLWIWQEAQAQDRAPLQPALQSGLHDTVLWNDAETSARRAAMPQPHTQKPATDARNLLIDFPPPSRIGAA